jgi:hypothetical protein
VTGGCLDPEFQIPSRHLFARFRSGQAIVVLSDLTFLEIQEAPLKVRRVLDRVPMRYRESVELTEEAVALADQYSAARVIGKAKLIDAQHIAIATIAGADVLVSWNFRHIVNLERIRGYNAVNRRLGYRQLEIRTPWEVIGSASP